MIGAETGWRRSAPGRSARADRHRGVPRQRELDGRGGL